MNYCSSRYATVRRFTTEAKVGAVGIGHQNPVRVQSMTTTNTQDVEATVKQSIALAEVGCEIVRVTAPNHAAARALKDIRKKLTAAGFGHIPLVADIHFLPSAAMEAVEHVEKIRVNPGNYADKKKFAVNEYSDAEYDRELQRIYEAFTPLVLRAKALGRSLRIGTNHGSLSDRIMNRYGDTPLGMVESALEFLRICESHNFKNIVLSMKASNPKVMIQAYRLLVARMDQENMHYPLHLGVTEAGDGEDGRIKSAIGIGSLLHDGLGDTIRVSLTEDSVYEIPVAQKLAAKAHAIWANGREASPRPPSSYQLKECETHKNSARNCGGLGETSLPNTASSTTDSIDPYHYTRREILPQKLACGIPVGPDHPPRVFTRDVYPPPPPPSADTPIEGRIIAIPDTATLTAFVARAFSAKRPHPFRGAGVPPATLAPQPKTADPLPPPFVLDLAPSITLAELKSQISNPELPPLILLRSFTSSNTDATVLREFAAYAHAQHHTLAIATTADALATLAPTLRTLPPDQRLIFTLPPPPPPHFASPRFSFATPRRLDPHRRSPLRRHWRHCEH
ncbi:(E)-4-hydroxy-3-methylbut-2-enyl-diphosphate synthase [Geminisphaera colitermitum]|uniref:(E)-4-hydroxy-3-methylbut-2-enyl-diphosphate synthase n=1 Tax=Geminisphaera colitermitum TaxID=1148786 RepID=UPI0009DF7517|nr:(E)-4-hydroxy-3-methylbut-2-enyl-diphosphate synthase [Geminisphaera colitermitum]